QAGAVHRLQLGELRAGLRLLRRDTGGGLIAELRSQIGIRADIEAELGGALGIAAKLRRGERIEQRLEPGGIPFGGGRQGRGGERGGGGRAGKKLTAIGEHRVIPRLLPWKSSRQRVAGRAIAVATVTKVIYIRAQAERWCLRAA